MSLKIDFLQRADHLLCQVSGAYSLPALFKLADLVWTECRASANDRVIVDLSDVGCKASAIDRYQLGVYCADKPRAVRKLAVVSPAEDNSWFFENVTVNRGLNARVAGSVEAAEHWLRKAA